MGAYFVLSHGSDAIARPTPIHRAMPDGAPSARAVAT